MKSEPFVYPRRNIYIFPTKKITSVVLHFYFWFHVALCFSKKKNKKLNKAHTSVTYDTVYKTLKDNLKFQIFYMS